MKARSLVRQNDFVAMFRVLRATRPMSAEAVSHAYRLRELAAKHREGVERDLRATVQTMLDHLRSELQPPCSIGFEPSYRSVFSATITNAALARDIIFEACEDAAWVEVSPEIFQKWVQLFDGVTNYFVAIYRNQKKVQNIVIQLANKERLRADLIRSTMKRFLGKRVVRAWRAATVEALWAPEGKKGRRICADWAPRGAKRRWYESSGGT